MSLYKYLPEEYSTQLLEEGYVLFRTLNYFIAECDETNDYHVRRDPKEGEVSLYVPSNAKLEINGEEIKYVPGSLETKECLKYPDTFFISCYSNILSPKLYRSFKTSYCVEILDETAYIERIQASLPFAIISHGDITYINELVENPSKPLFFYKRDLYAAQEEHRICCQISHLGGSEKYHHKFETESGAIMCSRYTEIIAKIGSITDIAKLHTNT